MGVEDFCSLDVPFAKPFSFHCSTLWKLLKYNVLLTNQGQGERATESHAGHVDPMGTSDMSTDDVPPLSCTLVGKRIPPPTGLMFVDVGWCLFFWVSRMLNEAEGS